MSNLTELPHVHTFLLKNRAEAVDIDIRTACDARISLYQEEPGLQKLKAKNARWTVARVVGGPNTPFWVPVLTRSTGLLAAVLTMGALALAIQTRTGIGVIPLWMPSGVGLGAILILGLRYLPVYWLGVLLVSASMKPWWLAAVFASGDSMSVFFGWWLLVRASKFDPQFQQVRDVPLFVCGAALVSTLVGAAVGVGSQAALGLLPASAVPSIFLTWWLGDVAGVLVTAPLVLRWRVNWWNDLRKEGRAWEAIVVYGSLAAALAMFHQLPHPESIRAVWAVLSWPVLLWASLRFGALGAPSAVLFLSFGTVLTFLMIAAGSPADARRGLWDLWAHTTALSTTGLLIMALDAARRQSDHALQDNAMRHRELFENAAIGIYRSSIEGRILEANRAFWRMLDLERSAARGDSIYRGQFEAPADEVRRLQMIRVHGTLLGYETVWKRRNGSEVHVRENGRVYQDEKGQFFFEGTTEDVTDRKRTEQKLAAYNEELAAKNSELSQALSAAHEATRVKNRFLANISHEIRTPMNGVLGATDLLLTASRQCEDRGLLEVIHSSARSLLALLDQILDLSKIEAGRFELDCAPFRLDEVLQQVISLHAIGAGAKHLIFESELDAARGHWVRGDALRLGQILNNLVGNAVKFTDHGSVSLTVRLLAETSVSRTYRIRVKDTGIGFDRARNTKLFEPFVQADSSDSRRHGGTGLGLAISRQLVELMGGRIDVESQPGKGTQFSIELMFETTAQPAPVESARQQPLSPSASGKRILVVEDNAVNQRIARAMLDRAGYESRVAADGLSALDLLSNEPFDLVLMDVQMPGLDGLHATRAIRTREPEGERIPIIALTASVTENDRRECIEAGMDDHLSKPITQHELLEVVRRWTEPKEVSQASRS